MNGTNESYVPSYSPTFESSSHLIITDDVIAGIQPRSSDRRNYQDFIVSIVFAALGIGLYVAITYFALRRMVKLNRREQTNDEADDLTETEDNADDERGDLAAV